MLQKFDNISSEKSPILSGWVDIHSHFLPEIDDGCQNSAESLCVLETMKQQGVEIAAATPHYYSTESVEEFLLRRELALYKLMNEVEEKEAMERIPQICLGAEVAYRNGIAQEKHLRSLCYGWTDYLLLELPFAKWNSHLLREIEMITRVQGITPVIAHFERYDYLQDKGLLRELLEMDILLQMNSDYVLSRFTARKARRRIRKGLVQVLGSDCHNMTTRPPNLNQAVGYLHSKGMEKELEELRDIARHIME